MWGCFSNFYKTSLCLKAENVLVIITKNLLIFLQSSVPKEELHLLFYLQCSGFSFHSLPVAKKKTLFAMICELVTNDGSVNDDESEVLGHIALRLGISIENMRMILTVYLIRNKWTVQVID